MENIASQSLLQQRLDDITLANHQRTSQLILHMGLGTMSQTVKNRGQQILRFDAAITRIPPLPIGSAIDTTGLDATASQSNREYVSPMICLLYTSDAADE